MTKQLLVKGLFLGALLLFCACQHKPRQIDASSYPLIRNGPYPVTLPAPSGQDSSTYFLIIEPKQEKKYIAQRWNDSTLLFLADRPDFSISDDLQIQTLNGQLLDHQVKIAKTSQSLEVTKDNKPVLSYQIAEKLPEGKTPYYKRGAFIHPLYSPNGKILSDDFPEGHMHQHGLFFAFVNTIFKGEKLDFWNQQQETGTIQFSKLINYKSGPVFGQFQTEQDHISLKHGVVLKERWVVTIYNTEPYRIDIQTTLKNVSTDTLFIQDHRYGGMAFRATKAWNKEDPIHFQNASNFYTNEAKNRAAANHSRPLWSALTGLIEGQNAGVALFGHPTNFRYPEPIRIHPEMPYFCIAPMVGEAFAIAPKDVFLGTYTFFSFDGALPTDFLNEVVQF